MSTFWNFLTFSSILLLYFLNLSPCRTLIKVCNVNFFWIINQHACTIIWIPRVDISQIWLLLLSKEYNTDSFLPPPLPKEFFGVSWSVFITRICHTNFDNFYNEYRTRAPLRFKINRGKHYQKKSKKEHYQIFEKKKHYRNAKNTTIISKTLPYFWKNTTEM